MADEATQSEEKEVKQEAEVAEATEESVGMDPVRKWVLIFAGIAALLLLWYLTAARLTPFSSQARVRAFVVSIAPEISGTVVSVNVTNNQLVEAGQELLQVERNRYENTLGRIYIRLVGLFSYVY